jgi:hypothetical protein
VYVRLDRLAIGRPILVNCRIDPPKHEMYVSVEGDSVKAPLPMRNVGPRYWVFAIPARAVRDTTVQLRMSGSPNDPFSLFQLRYYQPYA